MDKQSSGITEKQSYSKLMGEFRNRSSLTNAQDEELEANLSKLRSRSNMAKKIKKIPLQMDVHMKGESRIVNRTLE